MVQLFDDTNYVVGDMHGGGGMNTTIGVGGTRVLVMDVVIS